MLERYGAFLEKRGNTTVLDTGPVSGTNIDFFLTMAGRVFVLDLARRAGLDAGAAVNPPRILSEMEFGPALFDGIHLWDLPDHLESAALVQVVRKCQSLLTPGGLLIVIAAGSSALQPFSQYFERVRGFDVRLKQDRSCRLPWIFRSNRDIEQEMRPLVQIDSFLCMNGIREFLFKRK